MQCKLLGIYTKENLILSPHRNRAVTTFAVNELLRGRFCRSLEPGLSIGDGFELEASWKPGFRLFMEPNIEVTDQSMRKALQDRSGKKSVILYLGEGTYTRDMVDCISFRDWSKLAMEMDYFS